MGQVTGLWSGRRATTGLTWAAPLTTACDSAPKPHAPDPVAAPCECCAVLCCAVLCCAVLCCAVLCCAVLHTSSLLLHQPHKICSHAILSCTRCGPSTAIGPRAMRHAGMPDWWLPVTVRTRCWPGFSRFLSFEGGCFLWTALAQWASKPEKQSLYPARC